MKADQDSVVWLDTPFSVNMDKIADRLFERLHGCTGLVCYNDQIAYQVIQLALERGIRIPDDLSVVGIDDSYLAGVSKVPFTSILHPKEELGKQAAENLVRLIREPGYDANCLMETRPVLRESVVRIHAETGGAA